MQPNDADITITSTTTNWAPYIATLSYSLSFGAIAGGMRGGLNALSFAVLDENLIGANLISKHHFTVSYFLLNIVLEPVVSVATRFFPAHNALIKTGAFVLSAVIPEYIVDFVDFRKKIDIPVDSFLIINKFFDEKKIISHQEVEKIYNKFYDSPAEATKIIYEDCLEIYNNKFLYSFITNNLLGLTNVALNYIFLRYIASYHGNIFISNLLANHHTILSEQEIPINLKMLEPFYPLLREAGKILGLFTIKTGVEFFIGNMQNALLKDQFDMVIEKSTEIILENSNGRKVLATDKGKEIINYLTYDLYRLMFQGASNLNSIIVGTAESLVSLTSLLKIAPASLVTYAITVIPMQIFLKYIIEANKAIAERLATIDNKLWSTRADIVENIEQINLRDGEEFIKAKYNNLQNEKNHYERIGDYYTKIQANFAQISVLSNNLIDIPYFGISVMVGQISLAQIPLIKTVLQNVFTFISSNLNFEITNKDLIFAKARVEQFFKIISFTEISQVDRTINSEQKIIFKNYSIYLDGQNLVKIDYLELIAGKHYVITGKSGCGKTSTLIDLKEGLSGALTSRGEISFPAQGAKMMFLDQKLYLPKESTLLESIYFPNLLSLLSSANLQSLENQVQELFKELDIDSFITDDKDLGLAAKLHSTEFKLSGGQAKKIGIVQAILSNPDILIMDETFAGLDKKSLWRVEQALQKHLPDSMILSVDHHAEDNNYDGFYQFEVHFANSTVVLQAIASKPFEDLIGEVDTISHFK